MIWQRLGSAKIRTGSSYLNGAGNVQALCHSRDFQLQNFQVFAFESDGARGVGQPVGTGRKQTVGAALQEATGNFRQFASRKNLMFVAREEQHQRWRP